MFPYSEDKILKVYNLVISCKILRAFVHINELNLVSENLIFKIYFKQGDENIGFSTFEIKNMTKKMKSSVLSTSNASMIDEYN